MSSDAQSIRYGMFIMPFHPPAKPPAQCYDEDLELIVAAEELGFSRVLDRRASHDEVREHRDARDLHRPRAGRDAARFGMGPAPVCLQQHHPAHVACRLAFLDHLSKGRLNLCFGAGSVTADQELYGCEPKNAAEMVDEAIETILYLWTPRSALRGRGQVLEDQADENGRHGDRHRLHPQAAAKAAPADRRAGHEPQLAEHEDRRRRGHQPFGHCLMPGNVLADTWKTYETAALEAGRTAEALRLEGRPLDLSGRHHQGSPPTGAHQLAGQQLRVHRPALRQGTGPQDLQARPQHERRRLQSRLPDGRADHRRRRRRSACGGCWS